MKGIRKMAKFSKLVITEKGKELCAKSLVSSEKIQFTRMLASSTKYEETALSELESLNNVRQTETVRSMIKEGNCIQLDTVFSNKSLEEEYILNTVGLCAQLGAGEEVLFAVSTETANGIPMPKMFFTVTDIQLRLSIYMENADNVQIIVDTGAMATVGDVIDLRAYVDVNIENIGNDIASNMDTVYQQSTGYTDTKIAELINGAPSTLDTLGEIAQAMQDNENVVDALESAIGSKAPQAEFDGHTSNSTIHITASERAKWNNKMEKTGDASNTTAVFTQASGLANISTGEKIGVIMGKVSKAVATLISHVGAKSTASRFAHVKLSDTYSSAVSGGAAANGVGASQKAVADAYTALHNSLGGLTFEQDAEGNWGYKPAGADTVTPFKSGSAILVWSVYGLSGGITFKNTGRVTFTVLNYVTAGNVGVYGTTSPTDLLNNGHLYGYFKTNAGVNMAQVIETPDIESYPYIALRPVYAAGWSNNNAINACRVET